MDAATFLQAVWPASGYYALAIPFVPRGTTRPIFRHKVFTSPQEALTSAQQIGVQQDVYFCVHSLQAPKVWNPRKPNRKTGELGDYETRTHKNMLAAKCLFVDIDVGTGAGKYPTQRDAVQALRGFISAVSLPAPIVVSSGGGIHAYWPFDQEIPSTQWVPLAQKLKALAAAHEFFADPSRTADAASVLRLPGTLNHKGAPRPVQILRDGPVTPVETLTQIIDAAADAAGIASTAIPAVPAHLDGFGTNTTVNTLPPPGMKGLLTACGQIRSAVTHAATLSEPVWYATLGVIRHCRNGEAAAHKFSAAYPGYSHDETATKLFQLEAGDVGPTTCERLDSLTPDICASCPSHSKVKSPLVAARGQDYLAEPVHIPATTPSTLSVTTQPVQLPPAPYPYKRLVSGVYVDLIQKGKTSDDTQTVDQIKILDHDFFPVRRYRDPNKLTETHVWVAVLPIVGQTELHIPAEAMYDTKKLGNVLSNRGVFVGLSALTLLGNYMVAYIKVLQTAAIADTVRGSLGWNDELTEFTLPDKVLHADGKVSSPTLDPATARTVSAVHAAGTLARQIDLLRFFNHPQYAPNQFAICAALGAPLFYMTGHHGVIINMSGKPGSSKSTTLYTGAGLWGHPEKLTINGTTQGATANARDNRAMVMSNLPLTVDEITRMPPKAMADMAMSVTQSEGRLRLDVTGAERKTAQGSKSTIMLCTANTSLYSSLAADRADSTAESVRVLEIPFKAGSVHTKAEADHYLEELKANYGHIGEQFMRYVVCNRTKVHDRVRLIMRAIDAKLNIQSSERFWSAAAAAAFAACEIAADLGLLAYNVRDLWTWLAHDQIPAMRSAMSEQYLPAVSVLADYLETINANMLVLQTGGTPGTGTPWKSNLPVIIRQPTSTQLLARHELAAGLLWLQRKSFKEYCLRLGHNYTAIIASLMQDKIIGPKPVPKVLGAGTDYAKGQSTCWLVNMSHHELSGELEAAAILRANDSSVVPFNPQGVTHG